MPGIKPMPPMMAAVMYNTCGRANNWPTNWPPISCSLATRDTTIPAAVEMISEGICATRPSPIASKV
ncbi:hypothetical protein D3C81_1917470 [compost metagenome]